MNTIFQKSLYFFLISSALVGMSCSQVTETPSSALPASFSKISSDRLPSSPSQEVKDEASKLTKKDKHGYKTYPDSIRRRLVRTTSYSHQENEKGAVGRKNCQGGTLKYGPVRSAATDWSVYPVGTKFRVKGLSEIFIVDDYGSALVGTNTIDIYHPTLYKMRKWNTKPAEIVIIQMGDYDRSLRMLSSRTKYSHCRKMYVNLKKRISNGDVVLKEDAKDKTASR